MKRVSLKTYWLSRACHVTLITLIKWETLQNSYTKQAVNFAGYGKAG
jgi:hypothetical protein